MDGGKTNAVFGITKDEYFIYKQLKKKEFEMFQSFADSYFKYLFDKEKKKQETFLAKILAMFQVQINDKKYYYILMENIYFGIDKDKKL